MIISYNSPIEQRKNHLDRIKGSMDVSKQIFKFCVKIFVIENLIGSSAAIVINLMATIIKMFSYKIYVIVYENVHILLSI